MLRKKFTQGYSVHIAFIAMSGVRAASEELNAIGMTMPGFVECSKVIAAR